MTSKILLFLALLGLSASQASADVMKRIQNRWKTDQYINIEAGQPAAGSIKADWRSAMWFIEPVEGTGFVRIRNRWKPDQYLNIEHGPLASTQISSDWWSAMWTLEDTGIGFTRIRNRWKPDLYLHIERGALEAGTIAPDWWSAMWLITDATAALNVDTSRPVTPMAQTVSCPSSPGSIASTERPDDGWHQGGIGQTKFSVARVRAGPEYPQPILVCDYRSKEPATPAASLERGIPAGLTCKVDAVDVSKFNCSPDLPASQ